MPKEKKVKEDKVVEVNKSTKQEVPDNVQPPPQ